VVIISLTTGHHNIIKRPERSKQCEEKKKWSQFISLVVIIVLIFKKKSVDHNLN